MPKVILILSLTSMVALSACNTVSGAGADIRAGGQAIESTAEEVKTSVY